MLVLLSERIRQFTFNLSELHGSKAAAQRFFRGWGTEVAQLEQRTEELEWLLTHGPPDDLGAMTQTLRQKWSARRDKALAQQEEA